MNLLLEFEKCLKRLSTYLRLIGIHIDHSDKSNSPILQRLKKQWACCIHIFSFNMSVVGEMIWLVQGIVVGKSLWEITYLLPCLTLCLLGNLKVYCFIRYMHHLNELIDVLRKLLSKATAYEEDIEKAIRKWIVFLSTPTRILLVLCILGIIAFAAGPVVITISQYYTTGEIKFYLPFLIWYPFDEFNVRFWPFVYFHQNWAAWVTIFSVYGPDCFFFICCTFILIQFIILQHEMERIVRKDDFRDNTIDAFKLQFVQLVDRHKDLIRCVNLLEIIYSKATLFNVVSSSLIICATGFNLMAIENLALMAPFTAFLGFGLLQILFYCYYGDYVMKFSLGVGDAVYNSRWYETGTAERKYLLIVLVRSQKPCKLTAYGFTDVNLRAFTRILSTSWSYFALLKQMYHN